MKLGRHVAEVSRSEKTVLSTADFKGDQANYWYVQYILLQKGAALPEIIPMVYVINVYTTVSGCHRRETNKPFQVVLWE